MIQGHVSLKNLSGPLTIAEFAGDTARSGPSEFAGFLVLISLSLGFLNLLPIPILDGGQILFISWSNGSRAARCRSAPRPWDSSSASACWC